MAKMSEIHVRRNVPAGVTKMSEVLDTASHFGMQTGKRQDNLFTAEASDLFTIPPQNVQPLAVRL